jgi:hypothetical protein
MIDGFFSDGPVVALSTADFKALEDAGGIRLDKDVRRSIQNIVDAFIGMTEQQIVAPEREAVVQILRSLAKSADDTRKLIDRMRSGRGGTRAIQKKGGVSRLVNDNSYNVARTKIFYEWKITNSHEAYRSEFYQEMSDLALSLFSIAQLSERALKTMSKEAAAAAKAGRPAGYGDWLIRCLNEQFEKAGRKASGPNWTAYEGDDTRDDAPGSYKETPLCQICSRDPSDHPRESPAEGHG